MDHRTEKERPECFLICKSWLSREEYAPCLAQELDEKLSATLTDLLAARGEELEVMTPRYQTMAARVQQLRQKHPFALKGYSVEPNTVATNCIYVATLGRGGRTLKIGHAQDATQRIEEFNNSPVQRAPMGTAHEPAYRLHPRCHRGGEISRAGLDPMVVLLKLATAQRG